MEAPQHLAVDVSLLDFATPPLTSDSKSARPSSPSSSSPAESSSSAACSSIDDAVRRLPIELLASVLPQGVSFPSAPSSLAKSVDERSDRTPSGEKIKRPMNAFMVWAQQRRAEITAQSSKVHNSLISKALGIEWREMSEEQKEPYVQKAKELRDELFREYPHYVYRPRKRKHANQRGAKNDELPMKMSHISPSSSSSSGSPHSASTLLPPPPPTGRDLTVANADSTSPEALPQLPLNLLSLIPGLSSSPSALSPLLLNPLLQSAMYTHLLQTLAAAAARGGQ